MMLYNTSLNCINKLVTFTFENTLKANKMDLTKIDNIKFYYDTKDYPEFCDAQIISADYDRVEMTEDQLKEINKNSEFVYEKLMDFIF
jgi:hypothetical protein